MDESEDEDHGDEVGGFHVEVFFEAAEVVEAFVAYGEGDDGVNEVVVGTVADEGRTDEGDAVSEGEGGDEFYNIFEFGEEEHDAEEEEEVVVAGDHVDGALAEEFGDAAAGCANFVGFGHAVGEGELGEGNESDKE